MSHHAARKPYHPPERGDTAALLGLTFTLAGTFVLPPLLFVGLILSIIGLRSKDRLAFAIIGLIASAIMLILWGIIVVDLISMARLR